METLVRGVVVTKVMIGYGVDYFSRCYWIYESRRRAHVGLVRIDGVPGPKFSVPVSRKFSTKKLLDLVAGLQWLETTKGRGK